MPVSWVCLVYANIGYRKSHFCRRRVKKKSSLCYLYPLFHILLLKWKTFSSSAIWRCPLLSFILCIKHLLFLLVSLFWQVWSIFESVYPVHSPIFYVLPIRIDKCFALYLPQKSAHTNQILSTHPPPTVCLAVCLNKWGNFKGPDFRFLCIRNVSKL